MGTLLNKVLKDIVVRSLTMAGFDSPYVPGWDCHGLPIEHKVVKDLGSKAAAMSHAEIRALCQTEAMKWVDVQRTQFRRLGVMGDWDHPYLTLDPRYEAGILDVLADLVEGGYVGRQLKPIHWCMTDRTALAEAELEYHEETTPSIYVNFPMVSGVPRSLGRRRARGTSMIWTTTPWTCPPTSRSPSIPTSNTPACATSTRRPARPSTTILAAELVAKVMGLRQVTEFTELGRCRGKELEHSEYRHPFIDRVSPIVLANYVSVEDGTGLVHTAPGHGAEDYQTGRAYRLPILSPVDESGRFTAEAPDWLTGQQVFAANPVIVDRLKESGHLYHEQPLVHSYPHCWRCKKPVIFRATEQWFIVGRPQRPARPDPQGDRRGPLAARLGPDADRGDGLAPARLVHQPAAVVGRSDPGPGLHGLPGSVAHGRDRPPFPRPVPQPKGPTPGSPGRSKQLVPAGRGLPAVRRDVVPQGGRHPRRLVRVGLEPSRRAGEGLRPGLSRLHVPGRLGPAPRLVPVVDPDGGRDHRHRAVRDRADPRFRRRRARAGRSPSRWATTSPPTR